MLRGATANSVYCIVITIETKCRTCQLELIRLPQRHLQWRFSMLPQVRETGRLPLWYDFLTAFARGRTYLFTLPEAPSHHNNSHCKLLWLHIMIPKRTLCKISKFLRCYNNMFSQAWRCRTTEILRKFWTTAVDYTKLNQYVGRKNGIRDFLVRRKLYGNIFNISLHHKESTTATRVRRLGSPGRLFDPQSSLP